MVGGSTMMPMVQNMLARIAGKPPRTDIDPSTVVALGAAVYAGVIETQGAIRGAGEHQGADEPQTSRRQNSRMLPSSRQSAGFVVEQLEPADSQEMRTIWKPSICSWSIRTAWGCMRRNAGSPSTW